MIVGMSRGDILLVVFDGGLLALGWKVIYLNQSINQSINQIPTSLVDSVYLALKWLMGEIMYLLEGASWLSPNCLVYSVCSKLRLWTFRCRPIAMLVEGELL